MPWVRLDDSMPDHPKFVDLSDSAFRLWVHGMCYANRQLTDGIVPATALKVLRKRPVDAAELVRAGLWSPLEGGGGWRIHDYSEYQPTRDKVLKQRQTTRNRLERWRNAQKAKGSKERQESAADVTRGVTPLLDEVKRDGNGVTCNAVTPPVTLPPAQPGPSTTKEQENTLAPLPRRTTPVEQLPEPDFRTALAIAHAVMDAHPKGSEADWRTAFKADCLAQGWNYAARHAEHEPPVMDRAIAAAIAVRTARAIVAAPRPVQRQTRRVAGGRQ
jgi:hypothetical protein